VEIAVNKVVKTFQFGDHLCTLETGRIARQASGSVLISMGDTVVLATAVGKKEAGVSRGFFPLTVNYQEKSYAVGKVPGGYFKREGRPTEKETLTSRLIDRPLRPLFPKGFLNEVQVITTVMSVDPNVSSDVVAIIGAAAALAISGMPFNGPLAAARVGYREGQYVLNPSRTQLEDSQLNLVVAGTRNAVSMVESEADELSEEVMLGAVLFGHEQFQVAIQAIEELAKEVNTTSWDWKAPEVDTALEATVSTESDTAIREAYQIREKVQREARLGQIRDEVIAKLCTDEETGPTKDAVSNIIHAIEKRTVRHQIIAGEPRIDGRATEEVRPINVEIGVLPRTHGSALFTRGETQAIVTCTLR